MEFPSGNVGLPRELLAAIGHVAAIWGRLEYEIDGTIREALDLPGADKNDTVLIMPFAKRLELYTDLLSKLGTAGDNERIRKMVAAIKPLKSRRDLIVHGSIGHRFGHRNGTPVYWFRRIRWDRPARVLEHRAFSVAEVEAIASRISDLVADANGNDIILWPHENASPEECK